MAVEQTSDMRVETAPSANAKAEQNRRFVEKLAGQVRHASARRPLGNIQSSLSVYADWLAEAHQYFNSASQKELNLTYAAEWVLDNYYILRQAVREIGEDLPRSYYNELPRLDSGPYQGFPRIYIAASALLAHMHTMVSMEDLEDILIELQEHAPLTMGELWAVPTFLRYALIEALAHTLLEIIRPPTPPDLPASVFTIAGGEPLGIRERFTGPTGSDADSSTTVANVVLSLRTIAEQDWKNYFEIVSRVERTLREDPTGIYPKMDFQTRDLYRKELERLALASGSEENALAERVVELARASAGSNGHPAPLAEQRAHVGYYLIGAGRLALEEQIHYRPAGKAALKRWLLDHSQGVYLGGILALAGLFIALFLAALPAQAVLANLIVGLLLVIPAFTVATALASGLANQVLPPARLPKLEFKDEIPEAFHTAVVVPALITSAEEVDSLARQIEMHFLRNPEPGLAFILLTDYADAGAETLPEDGALIERAAGAIEALNNKYARRGEKTFGARPFYFLHRRRLWNPSEGRWMGWERKRGKLHELNLFLRGKGHDLTFSEITGDVDALRSNSVRFVVTLDADTVLPRGGAARLAGAMAHPLNRPVFDEKTGQVISGYTILQPRMEISATSANRSWFTRVFSGDAGLDLYSLAVSDTYQDLFGEGIYVGKGIYDVEGFERSTAGKIPENSILSHDLLEGLMGRAGLATDITMIEDYPPTYFVQTMRQRRWIRGDWQLLPWLFNPRKYSVQFSAIDRWKIIDNLRRSLLAPVLLLMFAAGPLVFPGTTLLWTALVLIALGVPLLTSMIRGMRAAASGEPLAASFRPAGWDMLRWLLAVAFLPYEAYLSLDAIFTTLYRVLVSRRNLLQWTTAAQAARLFGSQQHRETAWEKLGVEALVSLALGAAIVLANLQGEAAAALNLLAAAPVLALWLFSPLIVRRLNQSIEERGAALNEEQEALLRRIGRKTWYFFERFVGPEDHWLPPDHFQESPVGMVAHRTSPTNIGLLLTSTLAAYDMGYVDLFALATRLSATFETLEKLDRFQGHFLNWYDTLTLQPLNPRYVSTVDSGNLAACLMITAQASRSTIEDPIFRWTLWQGYIDTLSVLSETLAGLRARIRSAGAHRPSIPLPGLNRPEARPAVSAEQATRPAVQQAMAQLTEIEAEIERMVSAIQDARTDRHRWYALFQEAAGPFWKQVSAGLLGLVSAGRAAFDLETLRGLQGVAAQVERHHLAVQRTIDELAPWIPLLENPPDLPPASGLAEVLSALREALPYAPRLGQIRAQAEAARPHIAALREQAGASQPITAWLDALEDALVQASAKAGALMMGYTQISERAEKFAREMDFRFLFNNQRRIFHIGYNLDAGQPDSNFYDLLASEARIASLIAIARGDAPQSHWLYMSRPVTSIDGTRVLLSWSATMFEYLMPPLFLNTYTGTLLAESARGAVARQIAYGQEKGVPWGISESGFYRFDANQSYQYRAFGVPGLGFKRGLSDDLVIAPYASLMAVRYDPQAVVRNAEHLIEHQALGLYGFYEAIDFTTDRMVVGETSALVKEYMSHHQGMILLALNNFFNNDIMVRRMHSDPQIQSVELLLQEQVPLAAPLQSPSAEDVKGIQRLTNNQARITPWTLPVQTPIPQVSLLANSSYRVVISNSGSGYSAWRDTDLTRWRSDSALDEWGAWIYIRDMDADAGNGGLWSAGFQPVPGDPNNVQVTYFAHMTVIRRTERGIISTMEISVPPDDPLEIRRVHLNNTGGSRRRLRLVSYGEVILNQQAADARHPAFNRLFIESEYVPELNLQIFKRRPRSGAEEPLYMGHMLTIENGYPLDGAHEGDRARFIGRGGSLRRPAALTTDGYLSGSSGATLDPIFSIGQEIELRPFETIQLAYLTLAADSRDALLNLARRYQAWAQIERAFHQADLASQAWLGRGNIDTHALKNVLEVLSGLIYPNNAYGAAPEVIASNRLGQPGLWRFGISGDYPILLVEIDDPRQLELVREALEAHRYLRARRFLADLVILNEQQTDYGAELNGLLYRLAARVNSDQWLNQRGGIFILYADQMHTDERALLRSAARVVLKGERGALGEQLPGYSIRVQHLPEFVAVGGPNPPALFPKREGGDLPEWAASSNTPGTTSQKENERDVAAPLFHNGYGGFSADGREYVIDGLPGRPTPAPWTNVIGYPQFGFLVTESGSQNTWAANSGENRLTPWSNDPVRDTTGEALYLRDEETGEVWTPTPLPAGEKAPYRARHGAGYTVFEHQSHGLNQRLTLFASPDDPVKIIHLEVTNLWDRNRRITGTQYVEWVLGTTHAASQPFIIPEFDPVRECLLASNPYNTEFAGRTAFLSANRPIHGLTADRVEFIGRNGTMTCPAALRRIGLGRRTNPGEDPCAVLQVHFDLTPGASEEVYFILGQGNDKEHALQLIDKYHDPASIGTAWERTHAFWDQQLGAVQVRTPQPAVDLILNRWMLYQALSCRIWGRTAFYQSSGAFGFRDQLQDVLALMVNDPAIARGQILNAAHHQFDAGDVLHWWHPPSGRGVRTRFSDDLLWLPYVTALYVETTGDASILAEPVPFLTAAPLKENEEERYGHYPHAGEPYPLIEHCRRALEKGATRGPHGLPLMGTGDWNDGMNRVGAEGKGESVWLAWFLVDVLQRFAGIIEQYGGPTIANAAQTAAQFRQQAAEYAARIEQAAWDGKWYRRAYYDDGTPLGSKQSEECAIDSIAQSWSILSGTGLPGEALAERASADPQRARAAMQSVLDHLVRPADRLILLFTPPFDHTEHDPGYIKGYLPGIRENGGQYTHAAIWSAWAFASLGEGRQAGQLFDLLNPIFQADTPEKAEQYRVEPYVISADIYSVPPYLRRGGWTWYTGSAAWMYRLGLEAVLGFQKRGNCLRLNPAIPPEWDGYTIDYRFGAAMYHIQVENPQHAASGVAQITLDGRTVLGDTIPLEDDQGEHQVRVVLGSRTA